jgi:hypothetical protein
MIAIRGAAFGEAMLKHISRELFVVYLVACAVAPLFALSESSEVKSRFEQV